MQEELINIISNNGIVIMPTDTIYGIIAIANKENANKIYEIKNRDKNKPFLILVNSIDMLKQYVEDISNKEMELIKKYWPGELTIIFKSKNIDKEISGGLDTIGIRFPNNKLLIDIMNKINKPLISTSANISGNNNITMISELEENIINKVDYIYDNGICNNEASTIVKVIDKNVEIIREGKLAKLIKEEECK